MAIHAAAALEKIPSASQYFATQAFTWWKLHPSDPHTPDLLGEADRVLRNSCRIELPYDSKARQYVGDPHDPNLTTHLVHAIFDVLHKDYPQSTWAMRYKSWEKSATNRSKRNARMASRQNTRATVFANPLCAQCNRALADFSRR
ncbi:MAG: hypothetical protein M3Y72_10535 [Acidobacteriota bacterium]|nr:hypothetical protein [Acidobacteriota bacterium]